MEKIEVRHYRDSADHDVIQDWLEKLPDARTSAKIAVRLQRLADGNLGDTESIGQGLHELRIDWGPGYRVYFANIGSRVIPLLGGGDKRKQPSDIQTARERLKDHKVRTQLHA